MVASKVLNAHLKTIRGIVVKSFAKIDKRFDAIDEQIRGIECKLDKSGQENKDSTQAPSVK